MEQQVLLKWISDQQLHFHNNYKDEHYIILEQHSAFKTTPESGIVYAQYLFFVDFNYKEMKKLDLSADDFAFMMKNFPNFRDFSDYTAMTDDGHIRCTIAFQLNHIDLNNIVRKYRIENILKELE